MSGVCQWCLYITRDARALNLLEIMYNVPALLVCGVFFLRVATDFAPQSDRDARETDYLNSLAD